MNQYSQTLAPLAVKAVLKVTPCVFISGNFSQDCERQVIEPNASNVDLNDVRVVQNLGGTVEDTELVEVTPHIAFSVLHRTDFIIC